MIRALKGTFVLTALAGLGWVLRWTTAGSITGLRTYDLDSLTVVAIGTIAWIAYTWLALAVALTALEHLPGAFGSLAATTASRITPQAARTLLRSALGLAALTPLPLAAAQATPAPSDPGSLANFRATEPASQLHLSGSTPGGRVRVGVPDRPTEGAPTRYTELRPNVPVRVVVRDGDSLWAIAARELGPAATTQSIASRSHAWYAANRHLIGPNPDLIHPGQVLRTPPTSRPEPPGAPK